MDLCAEMLVRYSSSDSEIRSKIPHYQKLLSYLPWKSAKNFDRWYNRWIVYPSFAKRLSLLPDFFHIVDHSYAHLVNYLPEGKTGVFCHDLDAFKCILAPDQEPRPDWYRKMMGKVFEGLKKARVVFCSTKVTQHSLLTLGNWNSDAIHVVPYGVSEEFQPNGPKESGEFLLHVGSCIPRKRLDVLLNAFAKVSMFRPGWKLIQAGGFFSPEHRLQIKELKLEGIVEQRQNLTREDLALLYRGAKCLVITSDSEGFGLPLIEGMSCGARVVASDIPVLREVGGDDIGFFAPGEPDACAESILKVTERPLNNRDFLPGKWSWLNHVKTIRSVYNTLESSNK